MAKFHRKNRENRNAADAGTDAEVAAAEATEAATKMSAAEAAIAVLTDSQLKEVINHVRILRKLRREALKPVALANGTQVVWTVKRRRGDIDKTGEIIQCQRSRAFIRTTTGIDVVALKDVRKVEE